MLTDQPTNGNTPASSDDRDDLAKPRQFAALASVEGGMDFLEIVRQNLGAAGLQASDLERVRIPSGGATTWELPGLDGVRAVDEIRGIIVACQPYRVYYPEAYTGESTAAACSSPDGVVGDGDPGGRCDACPHARWGSTPGGRGQACSLRNRVLLLPEDSVLPICVDIPSGSLTQLRKYLVRLTSSNHQHTDVISGIGLESVRSGSGVRYSQANFRMIQPLDIAQRQRARQYAEAIAAVMESRPAAEAAEASTVPQPTVTVSDGLDDLPASTKDYDPFDD